jgi:hypothetical protein
MAEQINLSEKQQTDWALFLPAVSSFFISGLGKQREGENYFDSSRIPAAFNNDVECLNFLNSKEGLYTYKWGLYSAGHANLDPTKNDNAESIIRKREQGTFMLGDSGGFQILKGQWPADWKDVNCPKALAKRKEVLLWMDTYMDYGMCLDVPSESYRNKKAFNQHKIRNLQDAIQATHINNEYFINNRNGNCKFLNVMQGLTHTDSDNWYAEMKKYCDPKIYPDTHFNGWAFGGQTKVDIHLTLIRLVDIIRRQSESTTTQTFKLHLIVQAHSSVQRRVWHISTLPLSITRNGLMEWKRQQRVKSMQLILENLEMRY